MGIDILRSFATALASGFAGAIVAWIVARPKKQKEKQEEIREEQEKNANQLNCLVEGVQSILRDRLQDIYLKANRDGKKLSPYEKNNISYLYNSYKALGGNSYITELYSQLMNMEIDYGKDNNYEQ